MKLFVTGTTGAIGKVLLPQLLAQGHEVTALARTKDKAAAVTESGATAAEVSIFDAPELTQALAGHDAVINMATAIPPMSRALRASAWAGNNRIRTEGSRALVDAALAAGVGRLVQESITFTYPDRGEQWIDEDVAIEPVAGLGSTPVAEGNAARFTAAGRTGVVLRFGAFYGPGSVHSEQILASARRHVGLTMGRAGSFISSIHLDDAAAAVVAALEAPEGVYNVVDDEPVTKRGYAEAVGAAVGVRPWMFVPGRAAELGGERTAPVVRSQRVSNRRFREVTGWAPCYPSVREGWVATVAHEFAGSVHA